MHLSVVIPFLDEERAAEPLLDELRSVLSEDLAPPSSTLNPDTAGVEPGSPGAPGDLCYEVIAVDDGSRDGTGALLDRISREWPALRVIHHRRRRGQSAALATGFAAARGEWIATLDGDGQSDPADLSALLRERTHFDMVTGIRRRRRDSWVRRVSSRIAYWVRDAVLHDGIIDTGCSVRVFRRASITEVPLQFRGMHRFLPALLQMCGHTIKQVPVNHRARLGGRAKYGIGNRMVPGLIDLMAVRWMKSRFAPPERGGTDTTPGAGASEPPRSSGPPPQSSGP